MIAIITIFAALAAAAFIVLSPQQYRASSTVLLQPLIGNAFSPSSLATPQQMTVGLETEANLVSGPEIAGRARAKLSSIPAGDQASATASLISNTQILQITYTAESAIDAKNGADAFAAAVLESRQAKAESVRDAQIRTLKSEITTVSSQLAAAGKKNTNSSANAAKIQALTTRSANLEAALATAQATTTDPGNVVSPAMVPGTLTVVRPVALGIAAVVVAFLIACLLSVWRTWSKDLIDASDELAVAGVPIWSRLNATPGKVTGKDFVVDEDIRLLRSALVATADKPCVLAIASLRSQPDMAAVSAHLALALEEAGYSTLLVDAEIGARHLSDLLKLPVGPGTAEVLAQTSGLQEATTETHGVRVVSAGINPTEVLDRYSGDAFRSLLSDAASSSDFVLVQAPPLTTATGLAVSAAADYTLVGVIDNVTTHTEFTAVVTHSVIQGVRIRGMFTIPPQTRKTQSGADDSATSAEELNQPTAARTDEFQRKENL